MEPHEDLREGEEPPPPGVRLMATVRWAMLAFTVFAAALSWWFLARTERPTAMLYQCPMHPEIVSAEPGSCPICHMSLEPVVQTPLVSSAAPFDGPPGTAPVELALDRVQAIGVRTAAVTEKNIAETTRATAVVTAPEQGVAEVHVRAPGFVERVFVAQTGVAVTRGQALFAFYSPDILQAQQELLVTQRWSSMDSGLTTLTTPSSIQGARTKLELLGVLPREIDRILQTGEILRTVTVCAPASGFVTKKGVVQGSYVSPEATLYEIQDLSHVYVVAEVSQRDIPHIPLGTEGTFRSPRHPDQPIAVRVDLVYPTVSQEARTTKVRMAPKGESPKGTTFAPGEYGTVEFAAAARKVLLVPRDAVVDTGKSVYLFVAEAQGRFVPRSVRMLGEYGDEVGVEGNVKAGESVVSGATFLIDSESRLQASLARVRLP